MKAKKPALHRTMSIPGNQHGGHTLVEMIVVISVWSILLGGAAVLLSNLWRIEHSSHDHATLLNSMTHLAQQFREDVHAATSVEISDDRSQSGGAGLTMKLANNEKVEYCAEPGQVSREVYLGEDVKSRESFALPAANARFEASDTSGARIASIFITRRLNPSENEPSAERTTRIDAAIRVSPTSVAVSTQP